MQKNSKIYVAGHRGLVGSAIVRTLQEKGYTNLVLRTHSELDLLDRKKVSDFFNTEKPEYVFLAAAKVGGIMANKSYPAAFIYENVAIQTNIIDGAYHSGVKKLLFLASSCIYPRMAPQPMREEDLMTGTLEPTNEAYAVAKIAGIVMCQAYNKEYGTNFVSIIPTNLYGPNDNFDLERSHVLPALIRRFHEAKTEKLEEVVIWGTGVAEREFLYVDDLADASLFLMMNYSDSNPINIGTGDGISIKELTKKIQDVVGFEGVITWDTEKPDGAPKKVLDVSKLRKLGWTHSTEFNQGLQSTYAWFLEHKTT